MRARSRITTCAISALLIAQSVLCTTTQAGRHASAVGKKTPEFSGSTISGQVFKYKHNQNKALMVVFLSPEQTRSAQAAADIEQIVRQLGTNAERLETVIAVDDPNVANLLSNQQEQTGNFYILSDPEYKLWGTFGIIATPTVIISDTNDMVIHVKAGYGYDFIPVVQAYLNQALGIAQKTAPEDAGRVKTIANDTTTARLKRHLQMAKMLERKGRLESAIAEIEKARKLDPNSVEAAVALGELLCRAGRSKEVPEIAGSVTAIRATDKAKLLLISGLAKRQTGELDDAEKLLLEAAKLDPKSSRVLFELGKVYRAKQQIETAMHTYHKALALIYDEP